MQLFVPANLHCITMVMITGTYVAKCSCMLVRSSFNFTYIVQTIGSTTNISLPVR